MPRFLLAAAVLPLICGCATNSSDKVRNEVAAVVQDEEQRAKVVDAVNKGATPAEAMDKVASGPKHEKAGPP